MSQAPTVHFIVPQGIDSLARPSGGNYYDRRLSNGLRALGWDVIEHRLDTTARQATKPLPGYLTLMHPVAAYRTLTVLTEIPHGALVLLDGLIALSPNILLNSDVAGELERLRTVVLVHMLPPTHHAEELFERERAVLHGATAVVTTSVWARQQIMQRYGVPEGQSFVVAPGTDAAPLVASVSNGSGSGRSLLCVAAVLPAKGHDVLLTALSDVRDLDWSCTLVGATDRDKAFTERLRHQAQQSAIDHRITFTGPLARDAVAREYATADLLVLPSLTESYGMAITEALDCGLPVIASNVGGIPEALGHGTGGKLPGLLVPAESPKALAAALRRWLSDSQLRATLRSTAQERRELLTGWEISAGRMHQVLSQAAVAPLQGSD